MPTPIESTEGPRPKTPRLAQAYILLLTCGGAAVLGYGLWTWQTHEWGRFLFYLGISAIASGMKVTLSAGSGTMSMNFLFILIGIASLSLGETLAMGCGGILFQRFFLAKRPPRAVQSIFNVASIACSIGASYFAYHAGLRLESWFEAPLLLMFAACAFFLTNTFSVALVIALTEEKSAWAVWRESYFWSFPNYLVGAAVALGLNAFSKAFGWQSSLLVLPVLYVVYRSHRLYVERLEEDKLHAEQQTRHAEELALLHRRTIQTLAVAVEAKDQTTRDHLARVEVYAMEIGRELNLSENELKALEAASLLHDIGKLAVPEYIISKPGKLTPEEFEKMKIHPIVGAELIEQVEFPYPVAPMVRGHHEKWDGSGYPDGLAGEDIPIGARILATVDCLDALASDRQYRRALPLDEALAMVQREAGRSFDPRIVEVLSRRYQELERMAKASVVAQKTKLSTELKVERGAAPAAGFEESADTTANDLTSIHNSMQAAEAQRLLLDRVDRDLAACLSQPEIFGVAREILRLEIPYDVLAVYQCEGDRLLPVFLDGEAQRQFASLEIPMGMGLAGWVAENNKAIMNGNPSVEPGYLNDPARFSTLGSALAVPLETPAGVTHVFSLYRQGRDAFRTRELNVLLSISSKLSRRLELAPQPR
ncbi:HD domain-containing phosphohydrolase [Paludibaculum fermentans]|uniref:HD domain-containing phosphohydrolase n=1 Tax=Paludibaculum fermentans TaxID=1473598 RepID=UPI003EC09CA8